jgi:hypothetical protein
LGFELMSTGEQWSAEHVGFKSVNRSSESAVVPMAPLEQPPLSQNSPLIM